MQFVINVFSLGDYTPDVTGLSEAKADGAIEALKADSSCLKSTIESAFTVARKLGHDICVAFEQNGETHFFLKDNFAFVNPFSGGNTQGTLRKIHNLLNHVDEINDILPIDTSCLIRQAEDLLEAWILDTQSLPVAVDSTRPEKLTHMVLFANRWYYTDKSCLSDIDNQTLLYEATLSDGSVESSSARFGEWAEVVDGEPVINITLDDIRAIPFNKLAR